MKTQVAIIGAGPAGLLLGHMLRAEGVDAVIVERKSADHVLSRIRAGVLETVTTDLLTHLGLDRRLRTEGLVERGFNLAYGDKLTRIDVTELTGRHVTIYGQTEVTRDLMAAAPERGLVINYEAENVALHDLESDRPSVTFEKGGVETRIEADFIAGCDGFHGVSRGSIPECKRKEFEREYPFGWLGILADVPPCHDELIYALGPSGFALASMRSKTRSRYYIQVPLTDRVEDWPEERLWNELEQRFAPLASRSVVRGPALEKSIAPLRSYVCETMGHGRLLIAGDAAHIVPPTGAKGLNLAASDVVYLSDALIRWFRSRNPEAIETYARRALRRVWKAEHFSWSLTNLMHKFPNASPFECRMQSAELDYIANSQTMRSVLAENYAGLPL